MNKPENITYAPNFHDALKVYWSFTWRSAILNMIVTFSLLLGLHYLGILPAFMDVKEGMPAPTPTLNEKITLNLLIIPLQIGIGYFALRDLIKAKYVNFVFDQDHITGRDLLFFSIILNAFSSAFSFFAGSNLEVSSPLSVFIFVGISIFVSCALLQHVMSTGFFKGNWKVHLPVLSRDSNE